MLPSLAYPREHNHGYHRRLVAHSHRANYIRVWRSSHSYARDLEAYDWPIAYVEFLFPCITGSTVLDVYSGALSSYDRSPHLSCTTLTQGP